MYNVHEVDVYTCSLLSISAIPIFLQTSGWCLYKAVFLTFPHLLTGKVREYLYTYIRNAIMKQNL